MVVGNKMSCLTKYFSEKLGIEVIPEVNDWTKKWCCFDSGGVETEVGEFLYGLVKVAKPQNVLETGLYSAVSAMYISQALKDNGFGHLQSFEIEPKHIERSTERLRKLDLLDWITIHQQSSLDYKPDRQYELLFLDSEPWLRFHELEKFFPNLKEGGFALLHDLHHHMGQIEVEGKEFGWPWGKIPPKVINLVKDKQLRVCSFPSPRGLSMFYKPTSADYKWE